jgi:2-iminobutanoate/2-iminopropanoate deaminase
MKTISTPNAPAALGPYAQGQVLGNLLFTAGQIPLVPGTMELAAGPMEVQAEQVLANLGAILREAGSDWSKVVKATVFLTDLAEFAAFNAVYERVLGGAKPARSTVQVAALPKGAKVEIDLIAAI